MSFKFTIILSAALCLMPVCTSWSSQIDTSYEDKNISTGTLPSASTPRMEPVLESAEESVGEPFQFLSRNEIFYRIFKHHTDNGFWLFCPSSFDRYKTDLERNIALQFEELERNSSAEGLIKMMERANTLYQESTRPSKTIPTIQLQYGPGADAFIFSNLYLLLDTFNLAATDDNGICMDHLISLSKVDLLTIYQVCKLRRELDFLTKILDSNDEEATRTAEDKSEMLQKLKGLKSETIENARQQNKTGKEKKEL